MVTGQADVQINVPLDQVFQFIVADFERNYRRWSPEVQQLEMLTPGPLRVGSRARQVRVDQGRRSDTVFRVIALQPPTRVCFAEKSDQFMSDYCLKALGDQTQLHFAFTLNRMEFYMRPFEKLIRVAIQEGANRAVRNIKSLIERDANGA